MTSTMSRPAPKRLSELRSQFSGKCGGLWPMVLRRLALLPVLLLLIATAVFFLVQAFPGDPAREILGDFATEESLAATRTELGLDQSIFAQYTDFIGGLFQGDLGTSYFSKRPIVTEMAERLPATLELATASILFALVWGLLLGVAGAWWAGRRVDALTRAVVSLEQAVPDFVAGLLFIYLFTFRIRILPQPTGQLGLGAEAPPTVTHSILVDSVLAWRWDLFFDAATYLVIPAASLGFSVAAAFARISRAAVKSSLDSPQIDFARACGLRNRQILYSALTTARTPIMTILAIYSGAIVGATAIIETVFSWNGLAQWGVGAISKQDLPAILGFVLLTSFITVFVYVVLDVLVLLLDPRTRET